MFEKKIHSNFFKFSMKKSWQASNRYRLARVTIVIIILVFVLVFPVGTFLFFVFCQGVLLDHFHHLGKCVWLLKLYQITVGVFMHIIPK